MQSTATTPDAIAPDAAIYLDVEYAIATLKLDTLRPQEACGHIRSILARALDHCRSTLGLDPRSVSLHVASALPQVVRRQMQVDGAAAQVDVRLALARQQNRAGIVDGLNEIRLHIPVSITLGHQRYRGIGVPPAHGRRPGLIMAIDRVAMCTDSQVSTTLAISILRDTLLAERSTLRRKRVVVLSNDGDLAVLFRRLVQSGIACHHLVITDRHSSSRLGREASSTAKLPGS